MSNCIAIRCVELKLIKTVRAIVGRSKEGLPRVLSADLLASEWDASLAAVRHAKPPKRLTQNALIIISLLQAVRDGASVDGFVDEGRRMTPLMRCPEQGLS